MCAKTTVRHLKLVNISCLNLILYNKIDNILYYLILILIPQFHLICHYTVIAKRDAIWSC